MAVLREAFERLGFRNVKTVLASGNVLFETDSTDESSLERRIENGVPSAIGFENHVIVRTIDDLYKLWRRNPFERTEVTPHSRPYVTFVKEQKTELSFPVVGRGYTILGLFDGVVGSVVDLASPKTPDLMRVLDREFGDDVTTGSWKTIEKVLEASGDE